MDNDIHYGGKRLHTQAYYRRSARQNEANGNQQAQQGHYATQAIKPILRFSLQCTVVRVDKNSHGSLRTVEEQNDHLNILS